MNRTLKVITIGKWYHLETLKKFYKSEPEFKTFRDLNGKEYTVVTFPQGWYRYDFIEHPKTRRLHHFIENAIRELGFRII